MNHQRAVAPARRAGEEGSAYLLVLFLLVILTVVGLAVALVTQSEVLIGGSERQATREFYAAEAALRIQVARPQGVSDAQGSADRTWGTTSGGQQLSLLAPVSAGAATGTADLIAFSPNFLLAKGPCNLCSVNDSSNDYVAMVTVVNGTATRSQTFGGVTSNAAQKTISTLMVVQPVEAPPRSASTPYELAMQKITPADAAALKY